MGAIISYMAIKRALANFKGRVQGVYFRVFTEETARMLGLSGWVMNMPDGSVEALFEGEQSAIENAITQCRKGPPAAHVSDVSVIWSEPTGEFSAFFTRFR